MLGSKKSEKLAFLRGTLFLLRGLETSWDLRFSRCLAARSTWSWWWCIAHDGLKSIIKEHSYLLHMGFHKKKENFALQIYYTYFHSGISMLLYVTSRPKLNFGCFLTFKWILWNLKPDNFSFLVTWCSCNKITTTQVPISHLSKY